ncbi:MAG: hypothetical protein IPP49_17030 [Saprospiraceae bacterium]|nr:hypothetical protein [Saprospiraceae bacterium]
MVVQPKTDQCCSSIQSSCAVDQVHVRVQNGTVSTFDWGCLPRPSIYAFAGQTQFTLPIPAGCNFDLTVCVDPVYTNPYLPVVIPIPLLCQWRNLCQNRYLRCPCGVIKGKAWFDSNSDGISQSFENGINQLTVYL